MFETSVLAALSGETASFPYTAFEVYGKQSTNGGGDVVVNLLDLGAGCS